MKLRTFTAHSLPHALAQVRAQLGDNAVILSTHEAEDEGGVRVTAAIEDQPMDSLDWDAAPAGAAPLDELRAALAFHRVPRGLADRLLAQASGLPAETAAMALAGALDSELAFADLTRDLNSRTILLIGPPGAGKTATAAKLCAHAELHGQSCALITLDADKAGGLAQIKAFAEALEAPLEAAPDAATLARVMAQPPAADLVVIDSFGVNPFGLSELARLRDAATAAAATMVAVLPASGDALDSAEAAMALAELGAGALIATKLDVTRRLGNFLGAAYASGLPLLAAGISPTIGQGLVPLNPVSLAELFMPEAAGAESDLRATGTDR